MSNGDKIPQGAKFYLKVCVGNADGTMDVGSEAPTANEDLQAVVNACVEETEDCGIVNYVYECRAVRKVIRGKTKVIAIKP